MNKLLSLKQYLQLTRNIIKKFAPRYSNDITYRMLYDEDFVSNIVTLMILADLSWDKNHHKKCSLKSYRNQKAIWAMLDYIKKQVKQPYLQSLNITHIDHKNINPLDEIIKQDLLKYIINIMQQSINNNKITQRDINMIKMYYLDECTLKQIGNKYSISIEGVRQNIKRNIKKLRYIIGD